MNRASSPTGWARNPDGTLGWTWNPITGCLNGCEYCYARKLANGRLKPLYLANTNVGLEPMTGKWAQAINNPFSPRFWEDRLVAGDQLLKRAKKSLGIFPCDMSDWCGIGIPESWSDWILEMARRYPQHRFYLLTKQPQNLIKFKFPDNCWVGVTATDEIAFSVAFWGLRNIEARVKYISFEPLLGSISKAVNCVAFLCASFIEASINWVIIGALTLTLEDYNNSNYALRRGLKLRRYGNKWTVQPDIEWVEEIVRACDKAGIPVFLKDNLRPLLNPEPEPFLEIRQEMPKQ